MKATLTPTQRFGVHILLLSMCLEVVASLAVHESETPAVIKLLEIYRKVMDELIATGPNVNPERIKDLMKEIENLVPKEART